MTRDQRGPLMPGATHVEQWSRQCVAKPQGGANRTKQRPSSDWGLQLDPMKTESLVIADQLCRGEYVLELCTRIAMRSYELARNQSGREKQSILKRNRESLAAR